MELAPEPASLRFARTARELSNAAHRLGLVVPSFRSPPRTSGIDRTIQRTPNRITVAVQLRNRPWTAIMSDMIEGVIVANNLDPGKANAMRATLWETLEPSGLQVA